MQPLVVILEAPGRGSVLGCQAPSLNCFNGNVLPRSSSQRAGLERLALLLVVRRAKVSLKRLLSHVVECHNQVLDRRFRYRPVVLYACRCFFWDLFSFLPRYGAALSVSRGGERHK